jgi:hypothetical protein
MGSAVTMEGGIAILLLLIIVAVGAVLGIALYLTGGALWFGKTHPKGDRIEGESEEAERPTHRYVDQPEAERVHLAGTPAGERAERESR